MDTPDTAGSSTARGQLVPDTDVPGRRLARRKPLTFADAQTLQRLAETLSEEDLTVARSLLRSR